MEDDRDTTVAAAGSAEREPVRPGSEIRRPAAALMQPTFLPWLGYFALMDSADYLVLLDDFQFRRRSWHHRNRLFSGPDRVGWVTVPASHSHAQTRAALNRVRPRMSPRDREKLLRRVSQAYARCPHAEPVVQLLNDALASTWDNLAEMNQSLIERIASPLGVTSKVLVSSELGVSGKRSERLAQILKALGARTYLAAQGAADYMAADGVFPLEGIAVRFQNYAPRPYTQVQSKDFVPYLSAADALMQVGDAAAGIMRDGALPFLPWDAVVTTEG